MKQFARAGFTLVDLLLVMGLAVILFSFSALSLLRVQNKPSLDAAVTKLVADLKATQSQAMVGDSGSAGASTTWGVYIEAHRYTLFRGASYSAGNTSNLVVDLGSTMAIGTTFSGNSIIFVRRSGEITGFNASANRITVTNSASGDTKTITINRYGVITIS